MERTILVLAEHLKGGITEITYEMLGIGRKIADATKVTLTALVAGKDIVPLASRLGVADRVLVLDHPRLAMPSADLMAELASTLVEQNNVALVLVAGTNVSWGIGPELAGRVSLPHVNFCKSIRVEDGSLVFTSLLFGGKILCEVRLPANRGVVSIYPGSFPADAGKSEKTPSVEPVSLPVGEPKVSFTRYIEPEAGDIDITKQDILVAVGRGIENADNLGMAEELAQLLGGAVCASRPVIDQGWLPLSRQVGKSGMTVKPKLYLSLGISGAPEHVEGMKDAELILAFNKDPNAPIFNLAHYGVCADLFDILPVLIEQVRTSKGG